MFTDKLQIISSRPFNHHQKIAVVGNGGITKQDQEFIDPAYTIRFNNFATRANIGHVTNQCDMLWTTGDLHSHGSTPESVVIGIPAPFHIDTLPARLSRWYPNARPFTVNPYWCYEMNQELGIPSEGWKHPFPSIGFTCLWHLHKLMATTRFAPKVYVTGFNFYYDKGMIQNVVPTKAYTAKQHKVFNHHYVLEVKWIMEKLWNHPNFQFSPEILQIFQALKPKLID